MSKRDTVSLRRSRAKRCMSCGEDSSELFKHDTDFGDYGYAGDVQWTTSVVKSVGRYLTPAI